MRPPNRRDGMTLRPDHDTAAEGEGKPPSPTPALVPDWLRGNTNLFAMLVTAVMVGLGLFLISWLAPVLAPMGLGLFLAALAAPLFSWLERRGGSAILALGLTIGVLLLTGAGLVFLGLQSVRSLTDGLAEYSTALQARYANAAFDAIRELIPTEVLVNVLRAVTGIIVQVGGDVVFAVIVAALFLLDGRRLSRLVAGGLGSGNPVFREAPGIAHAAVTYFAVRIRVNAVTALGLLVLLLILGVDDALLWAVGAFFLSFVPYLGLLLAIIPPTILAFAESGLVAAGAVVVGGIALNLIAENVLEPTLTGRALSLSTWLVFTMFFFWVWLIGPVGALLSMPITVLLVLVLQHNERTVWVAALLTREGSRSGDSPAAAQADLRRGDHPEAPAG
jgi:predicted PurR-regulated permease PerM